MIAERLALLASVDPRWETDAVGIQARLEMIWQERAAQAAAFHAEFGHLPSYREGTAEDPTVGSWLNTQRLAALRGELSAERRAVLDALDSSWAGSRTASR